jgi:hypothetical protein
VVEVNDYIAALYAHDAANGMSTPWHGGTNILCPNPLRVPEFPFIKFRMSIPYPGVLIYTPEPDYEEAAKLAVSVFTVMLVLLILRNAATPAKPMPQPQPVPLPAAA